MPLQCGRESPRAVDRQRHLICESCPVSSLDSWIGLPSSACAKLESCESCRERTRCHHHAFCGVHFSGLPPPHHSHNSWPHIEMRCRGERSRRSDRKGCQAPPRWLTPSLRPRPPASSVGRNWQFLANEAQRGLTKRNEVQRRPTRRNEGRFGAHHPTG